MLMSRVNYANEIPFLTGFYVAAYGLNCGSGGVCGNVYRKL